MNVESTSTPTITKQTDTAVNTAAPPTATTDGKSFKDELQSSVKPTDASKAKAETEPSIKAGIETNVEANTAKIQNGTTNLQITQGTNAQKTAEQALTEQINKTQLTNEKSSKKLDLNSNLKDPTDPLSALKETINTLSNADYLKVNNISQKSTFKTDAKTDSEITLKMDKKDISFFLNLVQSDQMTAQIGQNTGASANTNNQITEIKTQTTQQPVQVSAALLDALSQSAQTGKSVRIDFDDNIAVVMKLDKNGVISANFIPGDAAVENYLRNNISVLQQNFNDKNIAYNELTYSRQQKQEQENQRKNNKEQKDE